MLTNRIFPLSLVILHFNSEASSFNTTSIEPCVKPNHSVRVTVPAVPWKFGTASLSQKSRSDHLYSIPLSRNGRTKGRDGGGGDSLMVRSEIPQYRSHVFFCSGYSSVVNSLCLVAYNI